MALTPRQAGISEPVPTAACVLLRCGRYPSTWGDQSCAAQCPPGRLSLLRHCLGTSSSNQRHQHRERGHRGESGRHDTHLHSHPRDSPESGRASLAFPVVVRNDLSGGRQPQPAADRAARSIPGGTLSPRSPRVPDRPGQQRRWPERFEFRGAAIVRRLSSQRRAACVTEDPPRNGCVTARQHDHGTTELRGRSGKMLFQSARPAKPPGRVGAPTASVAVLRDKPDRSGRSGRAGGAHRAHRTHRTHRTRGSRDPDRPDLPSGPGFAGRPGRPGGPRQGPAPPDGTGGPDGPAGPTGPTGPCWFQVSRLSRVLVGPVVLQGFPRVSSRMMLVFTLTQALIVVAGATRSVGAAWPPVA